MKILDDGGRIRGNSGPHISTLLRTGSSDGGTLHFSFIVDNYTSVIFEIDEGTLLTPPSLSLSDNDGGMHLFPKFRFALITRSLREKNTN